MSSPEGAGVIEAFDEREQVQLEEDLEKALTAVVEGIDESEHDERIEELRATREKREAWNCRLHLAYDDETGQFVDSVKVILEEEDIDEDDLPSHHTDPFYLAYGLDATALLGTVPFKTKFWPGDPDDPKDLTAARRAADVVSWFRKQNDDGHLRFKQAYFDYNDGGFAILTRYRPDAMKYGVRYEQVMESKEIELAPAHARCPFCASMVTEKNALMGSTFGPAPCPHCGAPSGDGSCEECGGHIDGACPSCQRWLPGDAWQKAVTGEMPVPTGTVEIPNAGPVYEVYGWLECRRPINADRIEDCHWIQLSLEVPRALALAAFPDQEEKIRGSSYPASGALREERFARESTASKTEGGEEREHRVTYRRVWLRPEMLWSVEDPTKRKELLKRFKTGVHLVYINDVLVRKREENLLEYWQLATAYPGLGHTRPAIGTPVLQLQRPHNELFNLRIDHLKASVPGIIANPDVINVDAMNKQRPKPLAFYAAEPNHGNESLAGSMVPTPTPNLSNDLFRLQDLLPGQRAQHASGIPAVAWGGQMGGAGETFAGYSLMREQGLQRMRIPLGGMKTANEGADLQAVKLFRRYHQDDVVIPKDGPGGSIANDRVSIDELDGEIQIRSDQDIPIPATAGEKVERFFRAIKEDGLRDLLVHSGNEGFLRAGLGDDTIKLPGQAQRDQQRLEIDRLLRGERVEVNVLMDDHDPHIEELLQWWASSDAEGERSKGNPNLRLLVEHYVEHVKGKAQRDFLLQALSMPPLPPGMEQGMGGPPGPQMGPGGPPGPPQGPPMGAVA